MNILDKIRKVAGITDATTKEFPLTHCGTSARPATRRATTSPGYIRHWVTHMPNPLKRLSKPFVCGMPRTVGLRIRHRWAAPTIDAVRQAERNLGIKLIVVGGRVSSRDGDNHGLDWNAINEAIPGTRKANEVTAPGLL